MGRASSVKAGEELRGFVVKIYPTQEELRYLGAVQVELMAAWNVLVTSRETHVAHCVRHAEDNGLIPPVPPRPATPLAEDGSEQNVEAWAEYARLCGLRRYDAVRLTRKVPGLTWDEWRVDCKRLRELFGGRESLANAKMFQSLVDTFRKTKGPRLKRRPGAMPLLNRTGHAVTITGTRTCRVRFGPYRLKGRYHRDPPGPFIEGVSIKLAHDGWYASAKVRVTPEPPPPATLGPIGVNLGLECLYADSAGLVIENPRGNAYALRVRELSAALEEVDDEWTEVQRRNQLARYQERMSRRVRHLIYEQVLPRLASYGPILIGGHGKGAAQGRQARISQNDEGGYVSAMSETARLIVQRYGAERALEPEPAGISRRCSRCGAEHKTRYQRDNSRRRDQFTACVNPECGVEIHVDVNAARNLLHNYRKEHGLPETPLEGGAAPAKLQPRPHAKGARAALLSKAVQRLPNCNSRARRSLLATSQL